MEKTIKIKIFSLTAEICKLINKVLDKYSFIHDCVIITDDNSDISLDNLIQGNSDYPDVIIVDKEIPRKLKEEIIAKFSNSSIICLPALDETNKVESERVKQISEPFRLSEFEDVILNLTQRKRL
jgi:hypothetical protein